MNKTALILLTFNRISVFEQTAKMLESQTIKDFDLFIYDAGPHSKSIEIISNRIIKSIKYSVLHTETNEGCWRRHELARNLAKSGYTTILFLDDDIVIPNNYIELALDQYQPKTYKSWWAWDLMGGNDYDKDRVRIFDRHTSANYCGAGVSIVDASIFLDNNYFNLPVEEAKWIDDVWLSFYSRHIKGWTLGYLDIPGVNFGLSAGDSNALYTKILSRQAIQMTKKEFVLLLKSKYGWEPRG